jgi:ribosomal-protein-alanine N-acetyltransferase
MQDASEAPAWSDGDLAAIVKMPSCGQRRLRRGWIAEDESTSAVAGFAVATALRVSDAPPECELEFVLVPRQARRRGIGRTLVRTVLLWASELGAEEIRLEVRASNRRALQLYEQSGFTITGHRTGYYAHPTEDAVLMHSRINDGCGDAPV